MKTYIGYKFMLTYTEYFGNITEKRGNMLESLFGNATVEKILFFLLSNKKCYASQLRKVFLLSLSTVQHSLGRLEQGGIIVSQMVGKTRVYQFNPRYPFLRELQLLLEKSYNSLPNNIKEKYFEQHVRTRPRKRGKTS